MKNRIFVDGMENISLNNGLVRINFNNLNGKNNDSEVTNELIMTPGAFLKAFGAMEDLVNKLIADGIITRNVKKDVDNSADSNNKNDNASPNFG